MNAPVGGTFVLSLRGMKGIPLPYNASQATIDAEIDRLYVARKRQQQITARALRARLNKEHRYGRF